MEYEKYKETYKMIGLRFRKDNDLLLKLNQVATDKKISMSKTIKDILTEYFSNDKRINKNEAYFAFFRRER